MTDKETIMALLAFESQNDHRHIPVSELEEATWRGDRAVRAIIEQMREDGVCILSDAKGYYLPSTEEELEKFIRKTEKAAKSLFRSLESAKRVLREIRNEGQEKLPV